MKQNSLLDIHKYNDKSLEQLHKRLTNIDKEYLQDEYQIIPILSFLYDIIHKDEAITKALISTDKNENIQSNFATKQLEKIARTYLKRAYFYKLKSNQAIVLKSFLSFIISVFGNLKSTNISHTKASATIHFKRIRNSFTQQHKRISNTKKLDDLQKLFPQYDIKRAFSYGVISDRYLLNQYDIEEFARLISLLQNDKINTKDTNGKG